MFKKIGSNLFEIPREGGMRVPGLVVATEELMKDTEMEQPLQQVRNVAHLPGIVDYSIAMPDIHWGYGFPIGGVAAMDMDDGVISPGGVGYDINCGVRLAVAPVAFDALKDRERLLKTLFDRVPSGMGHGHRRGKLGAKDYEALFTTGASWSVEQGKGFLQDLEATESHGLIAGADRKAVSELAMQRGASQVGTIGSGNHFCEIGKIEKLEDPETAKAWGLEEGLIYILIHSGSRGFGHQVCTDMLDAFMKQGYAEGLPDKQLVAAPIRSEAGKAYFAAMACAANYAFNNRQQILHAVRESFAAVYGLEPEKIVQLYDVCHNIAKFEEHQGKKLCVHRKGATRAFGPGHPELVSRFQKTGQPVIIPGDMGRASYVMAGLGNQITWCSCCHGAGRARSRIQSMKAWKGRDPVAFMKKQGVEVMATSMRTIAEEMPDAYKDVAEVVEAAAGAGLAKKVAKLKPCLVIKG